MLVEISEIIRLLLTNYNHNLTDKIMHRASILPEGQLALPLRGYSTNENKIFNQWLAGLIDGDGCFQLSKKGYASLEITVETRDKHCLYQIKHKFGGSIKLRPGIK